MATEPTRSPEEAVREVIDQAFRSRASDIHWECFLDGARVRTRVDGVMSVFREHDCETHRDYCRAIKSMAGLDPDQCRLPQDGRILFSDRLDVRCSTYPCVDGESITMRLLGRADVCIDIREVGLSDDHSARLKDWYSRPNGVLLVTGPTGSGKTTVLYSVLHEVNKVSHKVCSVEDPVEYTITGVNQVQINPKIGVTFGSALRNTLRQDPDIILVGEVRDLETAQIIIQAAMTGHLVLSTLHTNNASDALIRLRDIGLAPFMIKDTLIGVMSQRLIRKLCLKCREPYEPDPMLRKHLALPDGTFFRPKGCPECNGTGYRGRMGIFEQFEMTAGCKALFLENCTPEEFRTRAIAEGMKTLWDDAVAKAAQGVTSVEEVVRVTGGPE